MTENENLVVVAMEECAEVQQLLSKSMRFGFYNYHPDDITRTTNLDLLIEEYAQLIAVMDQLLINENININNWKDINGNTFDNIKKNKTNKVQQYVQLSRSLGLIQDIIK